MNKNKQSIIVIEPSQIVLRGLCDLLREHPRFAIVGTYEDLAHFASLPEHKRQAEITILNPSLVPHGKRSAIRSLFPETHIVALIYHYIGREMLSQFDDAVEIYDPESRIIAKLEHLVQQPSVTAPANELGELSDREKEILIAVAKGLTNKEIGDQHHISIHTVISHRKNISRKTGIKSVSGFGVYALLNNLIEESDIQ